MANLVAPPRASPKTASESRVISIDWAPEIGNAAILSMEWFSTPVGLSFVQAAAQNQTSLVLVEGGVPGTEYRMCCNITAAGIPGSFSVRSGDLPGIPIQVLREQSSTWVNRDYGTGVY